MAIPVHGKHLTSVLVFYVLWDKQALSKLSATICFAAQGYKRFNLHSCFIRYSFVHRIIEQRQDRGQRVGRDSPGSFNSLVITNAS